MRRCSLAAGRRNGLPDGNRDRKNPCAGGFPASPRSKQSRQSARLSLSESTSVSKRRICMVQRYFQFVANEPRQIDIESGGIAIRTGVVERRIIDLGRELDQRDAAGVGAFWAPPGIPEARHRRALTLFSRCLGQLALAAEAVCAGFRAGDVVRAETGAACWRSLH